MSIEFENLNEILNQLDNIGSKEQLEAALGKACALVERTAKENAPKGNGDLRRSIQSKVEDLQGIVFTPLEYAPYVEYGTGLFAEEQGRTDVPWSYQDEQGNWHSTSGMHPRPYMRPALDTNRERIVSILKEGLIND